MQIKEINESYVRVYRDGYARLANVILDPNTGLVGKVIWTMFWLGGFVFTLVLAIPSYFWYVGKSILTRKVWGVPGSFIMRICGFVLYPQEVKRILEPTYADFLHEYYEALDDRHKARAFIYRIRYYCTFIWVVVKAILRLKRKFDNRS